MLRDIITMKMDKNKKNYYQGNNVADIIKLLSLGDLILFVIIAYMTENFIFIAVGIISGIFIYALGEIIELINKVKDTTEQLRNCLERRSEAEKGK